MCGINGFSWKDTSKLDEMNRMIKHRGPDGEGTYADNAISLGHVRLSILDLTQAGRQPMSNEDETIWISFNGEIYNFLDLKDELIKKGHKFKSNTDTEVIIHAYEEMGEECVDKFNGMWAFAIYDKRNSTLFLSRDRFGVKPLYYYHQGDKFIFSSEIKGLLTHNIEFSANDKAVYEFLIGELLDYSNETFFSNIFRLMPGENLIFDLLEKSAKTYKWYMLRDHLYKVDDDFMQIKKKIRELFADSVRYRMISDVIVGSCLSGGIDSSSIVCIMKKLVKNSIETFSLVVPGSKYDESLFIDEVVDYIGAHSSKTSISANGLLKDLYDLIWTQEEPFGSLSIYGQYKVMELASKKGIKVVLDGQGGDELFAGYPEYLDNYLFENLLKIRLDKIFDQIIKSNNSFLNLCTKYLLKKLGLNIILNEIYLRKLKFIKRFYNGENSFLRENFTLNQVLLNDITTYSIPKLLRFEDKNSMRWGVESRVPFLDYRFVEYATSLGSNYKIKNNQTKYIFRQAMESITPNRILSRSDKIGFSAPDAIMLNAPNISNLVKVILNSPEFNSRKFWDGAYVRKLFDEHLIGKKDSSLILWRIIITELWYRIFIQKDYIKLAL